MSRIPEDFPPAAFIITAAGSGTRMGGRVKKEFLPLNGSTVLANSVSTFLSTGLFSYGLITYAEGTLEKTREALEPASDLLNKLKHKLIYCEGGGERQASVFNGLKALLDEGFDSDKGIILIHDGARPWISADTVVKVTEGAIKYGACAPVIPSIDAMKQINHDGFIEHHLRRQETVGIQTPQGFNFGQIVSAHSKAENDGFSYIDDTEIYDRYQSRVFTVDGDLSNRKITYMSDIEVTDENRTGLGFTQT